MILFISKTGAALPIVYRMRQEGSDVKIYIHDELFKNSYDGIIDKVEVRDIKKVIMKAEKVIFDSNINMDSLADCLENKVIGYAPELSKYEGNTDHGRYLAKEAGIKEKKGVKGLQVIAEMWFDGKEPVLFTYSIPNQYWLTGDLGLRMGSQTNCLWVNDGTGTLFEELKSLVPMLNTLKYVGAVSVDCTLNSRDKKPYFNNWRFGFRYDGIFCLLSLSDSVSGFFAGDYKADAITDGFACSERVTIPPYPYTSEELLFIARGIKLNLDIEDTNGFWLQDVKKEDNELRCAGSDGFVGIMSSTGEKIEDSFGKIYKAIRKLDIEAPLQFRIDGAKETNKKYKKLIDWGVCVN